MDDYIAISTLNDFIFCPYSIYLHNVYMNTDEGLYHATPQTKGRLAHESIDNKTSLNKDIILALPVISNHLGLIGKIDVYKQKEKKDLHIPNIFSFFALAKQQNRFLG